jgi:hypothetical protein
MDNPYLLNWKSSVLLDEIPQINAEISKLEKKIVEIQKQHKLKEEKRFKQYEEWFNNLEKTDDLELINDIVSDFIDPKGCKYTSEVAQKLLKNILLSEEQLIKMIETCCEPISSKNYKVNHDTTFLNYVINSDKLTFDIAKKLYDSKKIGNIKNCRFGNQNDKNRFADYFFEQEKKKYFNSFY